MSEQKHPKPAVTIVSANPAKEIYTDERCFILELLGRDDDATLSIARARVAPGVTTALHRLNDVDERYVIIEGKGTVELGATTRAEVSSGDVVLIPRGTPQRITNTGEQALVFLCVCVPPFTPECYEDLEAD